MNTEHVVDELSAYLDGEADAPERIAVHLQNCPECAHTYEELKKLSEQIRTLRALDVSPAFLTRVVAAIGANAPRAQQGWPRFAVPLALAAALALIVIGGIFYVQSPPPVELPSPVAVKENLVEPDPVIELTELENEWGIDEDAGLSETAYSLGVAPEPTVDEMVVGLADTEWFDVLASSWETEDDIDTLLQALDDEETAIFKQLLQAYEEEGRMI